MRAGNVSLARRASGRLGATAWYESSGAVREGERREQERGAWASRAAVRAMTRVLVKI